MATLREILSGDLSGNLQIFYEYSQGCTPEAPAEIREIGDFPHPEQFGENYTWTTFADTPTARRQLAQYAGCDDGIVMVCNDRETASLRLEANISGKPFR
jgi:hypothetical protein